VLLNLIISKKACDVSSRTITYAGGLVVVIRVSDSRSTGCEFYSRLCTAQFVLCR